MHYIHDMRLPSLLLFSAATLAAAVPTPHQFSQHFFNLGAAGQYGNVMAADQSGHLFLVTTTTNAAGANVIRAVKTDTNGVVLAQFDFGGTGVDAPFAASVDPQGNLLIGGSTSSMDFPLVNPLSSTGNGFLTRLDSQLQKILYSTHLAGGTTVLGMALDPAGNIYLTGTVGTGLPVTPGALQSQPATSALSFALITNSFMEEISAAGDKLIYATYYSAGGVTCTDRCGGGRQPVGPAIFTISESIIVDGAGNAIVGGYTNANNLAVTPGAYAQQCNCADSWAAGFIAKFAPGGSQLVWATYIPYATAPAEAATVPAISIAALALDSSGNIVLAGSAPTGLPTTAGTVQPDFPPVPGSIFGPPTAGYVAKMDSSGSRLLWSTYFGGNAFGNSYTFGRPGGVAGLAIDTGGSLWLSGTSATSTLPGGTPANAIGQNFVAALSADGTRIQTIFTAPDGSAGGSLVITSQATLAILGTQNSLLTATSTNSASLMGIAEISGYRITREVCPRDLISLYGLTIGPATPLTAQVTNGVISRSLGGYQVLFDGSPAALIYAGPTQINAIVPAGVGGHPATFVQIVTPVGTIDGPTLLVQSSSPRVLSDEAGNALALNPNGSVNSALSPAPLGSVVAIWMTGAGGGQGYSDNLITSFANDPPTTLAVLSNASVLHSGELSVEIVYAADAVGMPSGVTQINFRLPASVPSAPTPLSFKVMTSDQVSDMFTIFTR